MLFAASPHRFLPRSAEAIAASRREAAFRAQLAEIQEQLETVRKEQDVQFRRMAQIQQDIDEIKKVLLKKTRRSGR